MNATVVRLAFRSMFGRRRAILLCVLALVLLAVAVLVRVLAGESTSDASVVLFEIGLVLIVPLVALIAGTGVIAPEIDDGSIVYLLAKPISRYVIVISKLAVAVTCSLVFGALTMLAPGLILDPSYTELWLGSGVGALTAGVVYSAIFLMLSIATRHAVVWGLIYVLIWEGLLGGLLSGVRWVSVAQWASAITDEIAASSRLDPRLSVVYAIVVAVVVLVLATWFAGFRLRSFHLTGEE
ncbi:MAG: ABC transporter permease subunit [Propionibacteriales bacterium]|nr:ABC transporter permease subunit [Propionibacteriales bacterium]